jgi:hypothetical protein
VPAKAFELATDPKSPNIDDPNVEEGLNGEGDLVLVSAKTHLESVYVFRLPKPFALLRFERTQQNIMQSGHRSPLEPGNNTVNRCLGKREVFVLENVIHVQTLDGENSDALDVAANPLDKLVAFGEDEENLSHLKPIEHRREVAGLPLFELDLVDDHDLLLARARAQSGNKGQTAHLLRQGVSVRAEVRAMNHATTAVVGSASGALAGAAGSLLAVGLATTAGNDRTTLGCVATRAPLGELVANNGVEQVRPNLSTENGIIKLNLANHIVRSIVQINSRHGALLRST